MSPTEQVLNLPDWKGGDAYIVFHEKVFLFIANFIEGKTFVNFYLILQCIEIDWRT